MKLTRFGSNSISLRDNSGIPLAVIQQHAKSVFALEKHSSRSDSYQFLSTADALRALLAAGFYVVEVVQGGSRIPGKADYTKHMIRLRHRSWKADTGEALEILLYTSHDGTCSWRMLGGAFRFVCSNGLVMGDVFEDVRVKHSSRNALSDVVTGCERLVETFPKLAENIAMFKATIVPPEAARLLAANAIEERYDSAIERNGHAPIAVEDALRPRRYGDARQDMWSTFNVIQENLVLGGVEYETRDANARRVRRTTRPIQEISGNTRFNQRLHTMADTMARMLNGMPAAVTYDNLNPAPTDPRRVARVVARA